MRHLFINIALALLAASVAGQSGRQFHSAQVPVGYDVAGTKDGGGLILLGSASVPGSAYAQLQWHMMQFSAGYATLPMPFRDAGALALVGTDRVLVSGSTSDAGAAKGKICLVRLDYHQEQLVLDAEVDLGGLSDPTAIAWNSSLGVLAAYDASTKSLLAAPYQGGNFIPAQGSWMIIASEAQLPALGGFDVRVRAESTGFAVRPNRLAQDTDYLFSGVTWVQIPRPLTLVANWGVDSSHASHSAPLRIMGNGTGFTPPQSFSVQQLGDYASTLATGTQATANSWVTMAAPDAFFDYPGAPFQVVPTSGTGILASSIFRPLVRYGQPMLAGGIQPGRGEFDSASVYIGGSFQVRCPFSVPLQDNLVTTTPGTVTQYNAYLWIALGSRGGGQSDPVTQYGPYSLLSPEFSFSFNGLTTAWATNQSYHTLSVPQDSGLEGAIVLAQWLFQPTATPD